MKTKVRHKLILQPTPLFYTWLENVVPARRKPRPPKDYAADGTIEYVLPPFENEERFEDWLQLNYRILFKNELIAWRIEDKYWPNPPTYEKFVELFSLTYIPKNSN